MARTATIAVLGASGLIGEAVARQLQRDGFRVLAVARRFTSAQRQAFDTFVESPFVSLPEDGLRQLLADHDADIVVNCVGVLQDSRRSGTTQSVHGEFVARLIAAIGAAPNRPLLVHLSIPGRQDEDHTAFSATKREAETIVSGSGGPFVILRPGFVWAPAAYGGSALVRALAMLPVDLPAYEAGRPFTATDVRDIGRTVAVVADRWRAGERHWSAVWDVMERDPKSVGEIVDAVRRHMGGPSTTVRLPSWLLKAGALAGDVVARLGWSPPIRTTALVEMRRGVRGDPADWIETTGIEPKTFAEALVQTPGTVQERWFARLYVAKALVLATLVTFWTVSGLIAATLAFDAAVAILTTHGFLRRLAEAATITTSLLDILVGVLIAVRRTCRLGLATGIVVSLLYLAGASLIAPILWLDPLGSIVKTVPAIVLMLVASGLLDER